MTNTASLNPLSYTGIDLYQNPPFIDAERPPTYNDIQNPGTQWQDNSVKPPIIYKTTGNGVWTTSSATPSIQTVTGNSGGAISPISGNLNIVGSGSTTVTGSGNTLTISTSDAGGVIWVDSATTTTMQVNHAYIVKSGAQVFTLPASAPVGAQVEVCISSGTSFQVVPSAGQTIVWNGTSTITSLTSTAVGQSVHLICTVSGSLWMVNYAVGDLTILT